MASAHSSPRRGYKAISRRGGVSFIEHEIQNGSHRGEPRFQLFLRRHFVRNAGIANLAFGPDESLGHRWLGNQKRPGDFLRRKTTDRLQRQRNLCLGSDRGVATGKDEAQPLIRNLRILHDIVFPLTCGGQQQFELPVFGGDSGRASPNVDRRTIWTEAK